MNQEVEAYHKLLEDKLLDVLWSLRNTLPHSDAKEIQSFVERKEFKAAFELLVYVLNEDEIPVSSNALQKLQWLSTEMMLPGAKGIVNNLPIEFT